MIQEMDWIPSDFPNTGTTALMRTRFSEAVAVYSLQLAWQAAVQRRHAAPVLPLEAQDAGEVGVDSWVNPADAEQEGLEIRSHSSTELIDSDQKGQEATVEIVDGAPECEFFNLSPADPPSPDRCEGIPAEARLARTLLNSLTIKDGGPSRAYFGFPSLFYDRLPPSRRTAYSSTMRGWSSHAQPRCYSLRWRWSSWLVSGRSSGHRCLTSGSSPHVQDDGRPNDRDACHWQ